MASSYQYDFTQDSDEVPDMHCEQCEEFGESAVAEGFCVNCLDYMCKSCLNYHARQNQQHILQDRKSMPQDFCFEQCPVHKNKFIRFYCSVCEKSACIKCRTNDHKMCTGIGHMPTIARGIENSKEFKELFKDISLISMELDRTNYILNTCIQQVNSQKKQDKRAIEKKKEGRKTQLKQVQQMLADKFDRFKTDMITVINKIQEENTAFLTMELNMFDIEQTEKENNTLASLEKAATTGISNMRSLLSTNITLNGGIQTVLSDLNQKQNTAQRCKLFLALKTAVPYIKIQKQKTQELTTAVQLASYLPIQTKENVRESDNGALVTLTLSDLPESVDEERVRDLFRRARKIKCFNTMCGANVYGQFCQECGHRIMDIVNCKGKEKAVGQSEEEETKILVGNVPSTVHDDYLEMFFENTRKWGGVLNVLHVAIDEDMHSAVVEFEDPEAVDIVLAKCPLKMHGQEVDIEVYRPKLKTWKPKPNRTIKVKGVDKSMSREKLELYFVNRRRSDGGWIESIGSDKDEEDVIYITFTSSNDAERVVSKNHIFEGRTLRASMFGLHYYKNKVLIKGLHSSTNDILFNFIEATTGLVPETIEHHATQQDVAMVTFSDNSDTSFLALEKLPKIRKMCGASLEVYPVPVSNCIIVANLMSNEETVDIYFDNTRASGGGEVEKVEMNDDHTCFVFFDDASVIERVLRKRHVLDGQLLDVKLYHECLGRPGR